MSLGNHKSSHKNTAEISCKSGRPDVKVRTIYNARIIQPARVVNNGYVCMANGRITEIGEGEPPRTKGAENGEHLDANGQWLAPGFIDIHVHGGDGADVMEGTVSSLRKIARFHARHGTTGWLPTTLTAPVERIQQSLRAVQQAITDYGAGGTLASGTLASGDAALRTAFEAQTSSEVQTAAEPWGGSTILGVHLEGPMISPDKVGAQNPDHVMVPALAEMQRLVETAPDLVRKVTLAPEFEASLSIIRWLVSRGIHASVGHSNATYHQTMAAIEAGATHATHLFNAMRGFHHREGGTVGACLESDRVVCELIADGHHVDFNVLKLVTRWKRPEHLMLITDAIAAAGRPDGAYSLGGLNVVVQNGMCVLAGRHGGDGSHGTHTLAGSTLTMDAAVRNMVGCVGVSLSDAIQMASTTPARELGLASRKGDILVGFDADLVILDESMSVTHTFVKGANVYHR